MQAGRQASRQDGGQASRRESNEQTSRDRSAGRLVGSKFLRCHRQQRKPDALNGEASLLGHLQQHASRLRGGEKLYAI